MNRNPRPGARPTPHQAPRSTALPNELRSIRCLSFDCYGTLIDWNRGLSEALFGVLKRRGQLLPSGLVDAIHAEEWERLQELEEFVPYRHLLTNSIRDGAQSRGVSLSQAEAEEIAGSIGRWPPFVDTAAALRRLAARWPLAVLSNVDRADLELTLSSIDAPITHRVTADDVQCYKPEPDHLLALLHERELEPEELLHCSAYAQFDLAAAEDLGIPSAYIDRRGEPLPEDVTVTMKVPNLTALADRLLGSGSR